MDRRIVFLLVFLLTLFSTVLVGAVSLWTGQTVLRSVLLALATMWVMGILGQILLHNLYQAIVKPMEEEKEELRVDAVTEELNLDEVEEIDEAVNALQQRDERMEKDRKTEAARF